MPATYPGKQWGNNESNPDDAPNWKYISDGTQNVWSNALAFTFSSAANSAIFIPDSPPIAEANGTVVTWNSVANSGIFIPAVDQDVTEPPTFFEPSSVLANSVDILINGVAYETLVVNTTAFTVTMNNNVAFVNAIVRLAVANTNVASYLANSETLLIDGSPYTINVVNAVAFTVTEAGNTPGFTYAPVQTGYGLPLMILYNSTIHTGVFTPASGNVDHSITNGIGILANGVPYVVNVATNTSFSVTAGANTPAYVSAVLLVQNYAINKLTYGQTPNISPTESGWTMQMPGAQEILVALDGLLMPNVVALSARVNSAPVSNATNQLVRVVVLVNEGVQIVDANSANVYIVAIGSGLTPNVNLIYDTGVLTNTFSTTGNTGVFTADETFTVNNYIFAGETLLVGNTRYTVNVVNSSTFTVTAGGVIPTVANAVVQIYPPLSLPRSGILTFDTLANLSGDANGATLTINSTSTLHGLVSSYKQKGNTALYAGTTANTFFTNFTGANAVVITIG